MSDTTKRLAELLLQIKELDLSTEDKENDNAIVVLAYLDGRLAAQVDGTMANIANMILALAKQSPAFAEIINDVANELE